MNTGDSERESAPVAQRGATVRHLPIEPRCAVIQGSGGAFHPNEFDRHRIGSLLVQRRRYLYVKPTVVPDNGGYRIESPCCSRNLEPSGGVIDIARLEFVAEICWRLFNKDHPSGQWRLYGAYATLPAALTPINDDPQRLFWP